MYRVCCASALISVAVSFVGTVGLACETGGKCLTPAASSQSLTYDIGDTLPRGQFNVILNTEYHGLPATDGSFWYFRVDHSILKVDPATMRVLGTADR
ncbi:hypothetical protein [Ovoidimarina sediminis]|uniref:hypothetical protein n=1 Tax=Ovoidimarina sediminis TaxID=3079856 RepID=UPI002907E36C|nr:hypothetical protein [Rhodophyticola sp. MJ-SS7]MDU8945373.1 hypothetical protein [Rhodophyticola sp. MJ-SS7]